MSFRSTKSWFFILMTVLPGWVYAGDINWSGLYRVEGIETHNLELGSAEQQKSYGLHHLILRPSIVAADGITIRSRFDIFNSAAYPNSQVGQFFGNGPRGPANVAANKTSSARDSNVLSNNEASDTLAVNELYVTWTQEYGSLVVGRAPLQFGLGMSYSAGNGDFDHWFDNRDLIGYKVVMGNMFVMPMYGKMAKGVQNNPYDVGTGGDLGHNDDVNDLMIQLGYDNPETNTKLGVFFLSRNATGPGNDAPAGANTGGELGGANGTNFTDTGYKLTQWNIFFGREFSEFKFGIESGFSNGSMGIKNQNNTNSSTVGINAFGVATEFQYKPQASRNTWGLKMGIASGDQSGTEDRFEGFYFNRNYEVADLMFNHVLGLEDFLRTQALRGGYIANPSSSGGITPGPATLTGSQTVDTETVSNAIYISPSWERKMGEQWSMDTRLTYAMIHSGPLKDHPISNDLGYELDIAGTYKPYERLTWRSGMSFLFPGDAFIGGDLNYEHNFAWGLYTKAAIRF